jgi:hypothetical protein
VAVRCEITKAAPHVAFSLADADACRASGLSWFQYHGPPKLLLANEGQSLLSRQAILRAKATQASRSNYDLHLGLVPPRRAQHDPVAGA